MRDLNLDKLFVRTVEGIQIPVSEVASIDLVNGPLQINRDATKRRIVIGVNVRDADIQQVVSAIRESLDKNVKLKPGYYFEYGGQFENLQNAIRTLTLVIPYCFGIDFVASFLCIQKRNLFPCGLLYGSAVSDRRYSGLVGTRVAVQHLGRCRIHRLVWCCGSEWYIDD